MRQSLLYISYYFPPIKSIAVKRNYYFAMGLKKYFKEVNILTTSNKNILDNEKTNLDGLVINPLFTFDYRTIISKFKKKKDTHFSENQKSGRLIKFLIRVNESFPFNLLIGEGGLFYIIHGFIAGNKILKQAESKIIFTSFRPFSNVFIGYLLKLKFSNVKWIVSFHDIPVENLRKNLILLYLQNRVWRKILGKCDLAVTVSDGINGIIRDFYPNVVTILNGITPRISSNQDSFKFRMVYTGSIYLGYRDPTLLFNCISELISNKTLEKEKIELIYAGKDKVTWKNMISTYNLNDISQEFDDLPLNDALKLQESAHLNILLTWASKDQKGILTGKLFEYLGSGNLILTIINGSMDEEIASLFEEIGCGKVVASNDLTALDQLKDFINVLYKDWKFGKPLPPYISKLDKYSWDCQVEKLADCIHYC